MLLKNIPIATLGLAGLFSFGQAASFSQNCENLIVEYPNFWEDEFILSIFEENFSDPQQPLDFYELFDIYVKKFQACQNTAYTETGISNFFKLNEEFLAIESEFLSFNARKVPVQTKDNFIVAASLVGNSANINLIPEGPFDGNDDEGCATGEEEDDQVDFSLNIKNLKDDIFDDGEENDNSESSSINGNSDYNGEYDDFDHEQALINQYKAAEEESARLAALSQQKIAAEKLAAQKIAEEKKQKKLEAEKAAKIAAELEAAKFAAETAAAEKAAAEIEAAEEAERIAAVIAAAEEAERIAAEKEAAAKLAAEQEAAEAAAVAAAAAEQAAKLAAEEKAAAKIAAEEAAKLAAEKEAAAAAAEEEAAKLAAEKEAAEKSAQIEQSVKQASENAEQTKENTKFGFSPETHENEISDILEIENNEGSLGHAGFLTNDESDNSENGENSEKESSSSAKSDSKKEDKHVSMSIFAAEDTPVGTGKVVLTGFSLIVAICVAMM